MGFWSDSNTNMFKSIKINLNIFSAFNLKKLK